MRIVLHCCLLLLLFQNPVRAGQFCTEQPIGPDALRQGLQLALKTRNALETAGATVAVLGRVGADLSEHGLRYSHAGFVWRDHPQGQWLVIHELNQCATARSHLSDEGLGNFFLDTPFAYETLIVIPSPAAQQQLANLLSSTVPDQLHQPNYSMIANPWETRYQNSNQWLLEILAATLSASAVQNRSQAQHWLRQNGYQPSQIHLSALQRVGAKLFSANVQFDDHSLADRIAGRYQVVTVESVVRFLHHHDPQMTQFIISLD